MKKKLGWVWRCLECGKVFKTTKAAEKASFDGCPKCGGVDIDMSDGRGISVSRLSVISLF